MDPDTVTVIASAVTAGAVAGLKDTATSAVKDAYAELKRLIGDRYQVDVSLVENKPDSQAKRDSLAEDLQDAGADADVELLDAAQQVFAAVAEDAPEAGPAIGVDLEQLRAAAVKIRDVIATGTGVRGRDWTVAGDVDITGVRAGHTPGSADPPTR